MILSCWFQLYFSMVPMQINSRIKINFHRKFEFNQISADKSGGARLKKYPAFSLFSTNKSTPDNPPRIIHPGDSSGNPRISAENPFLHQKSDILDRRWIFFSRRKNLSADFQFSGSDIEILDGPTGYKITNTYRVTNWSWRGPNNSNVVG